MKREIAIDINYKLGLIRNSILKEALNPYSDFRNLHSKLDKIYNEVYDITGQIRDILLNNIED